MTELAKLFDDVDLFHGIPYADVKLLSGYFQLIDTKKNQLLFSEGEPGNAMYIILEGKVQVGKILDNKIQPLAVEGKGKVLGEMSLLDGEVRSATCTVTEAGNIAIMTQDAFARLEKDHPALALRFLKLIVRLVSRRLRMTTGRLSQLLT